MKNKKFLLVIAVVAYWWLFGPAGAVARRGCCSNHGGVCGERCCDGAPLSAKCRGGAAAGCGTTYVYDGDTIKVTCER